VAVLFEKKLYGSRLPSDIVKSLHADAFNCSASELNKKWLADLQSNNIPVNIYTVNNEKKMKQYLKTSVSGIFTNKPDVLKSLLADRNQISKKADL